MIVKRSYTGVSAADLIDWNCVKSNLCQHAPCMHMPQTLSSEPTCRRHAQFLNSQ